MPERPQNGDDYIEYGIGAAWDVLRASIEVPPSLDVFLQEWKVVTERVGIVSAVDLAENLVESHRTYQ